MIRTVRTVIASIATASLMWVLPAPAFAATTPGVVDVRVMSTTSTTATLSWTARDTGGATISDYRVEYSTDGTNWSTFNDGVSTSTTTVVTGLLPLQAYYFRVQAQNSSGWGKLHAKPIAIAQGDDPCVLLDDGTIECWRGARETLTRWTIPGAANVTKIAMHGSRLCFITSTNNLTCGRLSAANTTFTVTPSLSKSGILDVDLRADEQSPYQAGATCWISTDNNVGCADAAPFGFAAPTDISNAVQISVGKNYACARLSGGTVRCWGDNQYGALGDGTTQTPTSGTSVEVAGVSTATDISVDKATNSLSCAVTGGGKVKCWGLWSSEYQRSGPAPADLLDIENARDVQLGLGVNVYSSGSPTVCATRVDGRVLCSARGNRVDDGYLPSSNGIPPFTRLTLLTGVSQLASGFGGTRCFLKSTGLLTCSASVGNSEFSNITGWPQNNTDAYSPHYCYANSFNNNDCGDPSVAIAGDVSEPWSRGQTQPGFLTVSNAQVLVTGSRATISWETNDGGLSRLQTANGNCQLDSGFDDGDGVHHLPENTLCWKYVPGSVEIETSTNGSFWKPYNDLAQTSQGVSRSYDPPYESRGVLNSFQLTHLLPGQPYFVKFRIATGADLGIYGAFQSAWTVLSVAASTSPLPAPVTGLDVTSTGTNGFSLKWNAPANASALTNLRYKVEYRIAGSPNWAISAASQESTLATISGLTSNAGYEVQVTALASSGESLPVSLGTPESVSTGNSHSCLATRDGLVYCWGANTRGQVGNGTTRQVDQPTRVALPQKVSKVVASGDHSCALTDAGAVFCWGLGTSGELGNGQFKSSTTPVQVAGLPQLKVISAGLFHNCGVESGGAVWCWGANTSSQLGANLGARIATPSKVPNVSNASIISAGGAHTCVGFIGGENGCWGSNTYFQLGYSTGEASSLKPLRPAGVDGPGDTLSGPLQRSISISASNAATCWADVIGDVRCVGANVGSFYPGSRDRTARVNSLSEIQSNTNHFEGPFYEISRVATMSVGPQTSCFAKFDGQLVCWGTSTSGSVGSGSFDQQLFPVTVSGIEGVQEVSVGTNDTPHTCAIGSTGGVQCWGNNDHGQLGTGDTVDTPWPEDSMLVTDKYAYTVAPGSTVQATLNVRTSGGAPVSGGTYTWESVDGRFRSTTGVQATSGGVVTLKNVVPGLTKIKVTGGVLPDGQTVSGSWTQSIWSGTFNLQAVPSVMPISKTAQVLMPNGTPVPGSNVTLSGVDNTLTDATPSSTLIYQASTATKVTNATDGSGLTAVGGYPTGAGLYVEASYSDDSLYQTSVPVEVGSDAITPVGLPYMPYVDADVTSRSVTAGQTAPITFTVMNNGTPIVGKTVSLQESATPAGVKTWGESTSGYSGAKIAAVSCPATITGTTNSLGRVTLNMCSNTVGTRTYKVIAPGTVREASQVTVAVSPVLNPPASPSAPTVVADNATATVSWVKPAENGSTIDYYKVSISSSATGTFTAVGSGNCSGNVVGLSCNLTGLTNGSNYFVKVKAHNAGGLSADSPASAVFTPRAPQLELVISNTVQTNVAGTAVALTTSGGSGTGAVTYSVTGTGCAISASSLSTTVPTTCLVTAQKAASGAFKSATSQPVSFTFTAKTQARLAISNTPLAVVRGSTVTLTTSGGSGTGAVTYFVTGTGCRIASVNKLTADAGSQCSVTAQKAAQGIYASALSDAVTFSFTK